LQNLLKFKIKQESKGMMSPALIVS